MASKDTIAVGHNVRAGLRIATTWGTAIDCDAAEHANELNWEGIRISSESVNISAPVLENPSISNNAMQFVGSGAEKRAEGSITFAGPYYQGMERLFALLMGEHEDDADGTAAAPQRRGTKSCWYGFFRLRNDMEGIMGSMAIHKDINIGSAADQTDSTMWEYETFKVDTFNLSWAGGNSPVTFEFGLVCSDINIADQTDANTDDATEFAPGYETNLVLIRPNEFKLYLGNQGDTLNTDTAGNEIDVLSFNMSMSRGYDRNISSSLGHLIDEPAPAAFTTVTGSFSMNKYNTATAASDPQFDQYFDSTGTVVNKTEKMLVGEFVSKSVITTSMPYVWGFMLPSVMFESMDANVAGPGRIAFNVGFRAFEAATASIVSNVPNSTIGMMSNVAAGISSTTPIFFYQSGADADPLVLQATGARGTGV